MKSFAEECKKITKTIAVNILSTGESRNVRKSRGWILVKGKMLLSQIKRWAEAHYKERY